MHIQEWGAREMIGSCSTKQGLFRGGPHYRVVWWGSLVGGSSVWVSFDLLTWPGLILQRRIFQLSAQRAEGWLPTVSREPRESQSESLKSSCGFSFHLLPYLTLSPSVPVTWGLRPWYPSLPLQRPNLQSSGGWSKLFMVVEEGRRWGRWF